MENNLKYDLDKEPIKKLLVKLAIPTIFAQIINMLYNIVDRVYIGHIPKVGDLALTGVGVCLPLIMIVAAFAAFVGMGGAPRASIFMGKKDLKSAENILGNCFILQIIISIILTILLLVFNKPLLLAFGASKNTIDYSLNYMNIYAIGTIFVQLTLGLNLFITAQGFTKIGMISIAIGAISNIILDPIFIYVFNLGIKGAAIATIMSQAISCFWILLFLTGDKTKIKIKAKNFILKASIVFPALALGSSSFVMQASESVISLCFNSSLLKYGGDVAVCTMTILTSVMQFAMLPLQGLGQGAQPILSYNFGAKKINRVKETFKYLLLFSLIYSFVLWLFVMIFPSAFIKIFISDKKIIEFATSALRIYMATSFMFGIQIACQMTFTSLGNAKSSIIVAVTRKFVLLLPLIFIMPQIFTKDKTRSVYLAEPIADFIAVSFTAVLFYFEFKKVLNNNLKLNDKLIN